MIMTKRLQLFSARDCAACHLLKRYLDRNDIAYVDVDVNANRWAASLMNDRGLKTVPQIFYRDQLFVPGAQYSLQTMTKNEIYERMEKLDAKIS